MQIYAARNNQRRYCFFYLILVLICHCFIASKPQSFHVDDRQGKGQYTRQNGLPIEFLARLENRPRQTGDWWVIILLPPTSRNSWAMYPLLLISLETSPGLFSGSWETNLNTTLRLMKCWSDDDKRCTSKTWQKAGELEAVLMNVCW